MKKILLLVFAVVFAFGFLGIKHVMAATDIEILQPAATKTLTYTNNVIWKGDLAATKSITVGTKTNKGKLYVKGTISNPNKKKSVVVNDNLTVKGNLQVTGGTLQGSSIVTTDNLAADAITSAKITDGAIATADLADSSVTSAKIASGTIASSNMSFSGHGFAKAGGNIASNGSVSSSFNNLGSDISAAKNGTGTYVVTIPSLGSLDYVVTMINGATPSFISAVVNSNSTVTVSTYDASLAQPTDRAFYFFVY